MKNDNVAQRLPSRNIAGTFEPYLERWEIEIDGEQIETPYSRLLPVRYRGNPAMLKLLLFPEERNGSRVLDWWKGRGAARVYEIDDGAVLIERAIGDRSLTRMVLKGRDEEAAKILIRTASTLHEKRGGTAPEEVVPLERWFEPLWRASDSADLFVSRAARIARPLIDDPGNVVVLHGDLHHGNVLDFGDRGWLAIDPKGLKGEQGFEFSNVFRNPPTGDQFAPGRMEWLADLISSETGIPADRLLRWVVAFCGLSVTWAEEKDDEYRGDLALGNRAAVLLGLD